MRSGGPGSSCLLYQDSLFFWSGDSFHKSGRWFKKCTSMLQILVYWLQHDLFLTIRFQFKKKTVGAPLPHIQFKYHDIIIFLSIISASAIFKPCDQLFRPRITLWGGKSIHIFAPNFVFVTHLDITLLPVNTELLRFRE